VTVVSQRTAEATGGAAPATNASSNRLRSLDGLRGVAAAVVVLHHTFLTRSSLAVPYLNPYPTQRGTAAWWATYTPLHLLWDGTEAVFVFFVLSGFVLTMRAARTRSDWLRYYPKRLVRLYLPVWVAVAVALGWATLVPRHTVAGASWWMNLVHPGTPDAHAVLRDLLLVVGNPGASNSVLWSLRWEVYFSLLLPAFVLIACCWRRIWPLKLVAALALISWGVHVHSNAAFYLPMFAVGGVLAAERDRLASVAARVNASRNARGIWLGLGALTLLLLNSYWTVFTRQWPPGRAPELACVARGLETLGAATAIFMALHCPPVRRALERRPTQWLGKRSFSLYLVHEPIVVSVALLLGGQPALWLTAALAVPASLLAAEIFYRLVERPAISLARMMR
jgi:peptidoglycan/LPS O-acetylase OafA/YrhL